VAHPKVFDRIGQTMDRPTKQPKGMATIWVFSVIVIVFAFMAFAVDYGRVQLARTELQRAADAAALAAAANLPTISTVISTAQAMATANKVDGTGTTLVTGNGDETLNDVQFVTWNDSTRAYTVLTGSNRTQADAVRVILRRTVARGTAIPLLFGGLIGLPPLDTYGVGIASRSFNSYAVVGLDSITMGGNTTASYFSASGSSVTAKFGNIASNGNISLSGSSFINGNALPGVGMSVNNPSKVAGSTTPLTGPLTFPSLPSGAPTDYESVNNNSHFLAYSGISYGSTSCPGVSINGSGTYILPGGIYFVDSFSVSRTSTLQFNSPTIIFCNGTFMMKGNPVTKADLPANLTLVMVYASGRAPGSASIDSSSAFYGTVYAPYSAVTLSGTGDIYGCVLGKSISMTGTSRIIYDRSLSATGQAMTLVR
jgi:Flp pilus assembly protein TadG